MAPIVFIHGLFGNLRDPENLKSFKGKIIYAPDLIGYGQFRTRNAIRLEDQVNHIYDFVEKNSLKSINLVGHSIGGAIAVLAANTRPDIIASITSVEGNFTLKDAFWTRELCSKTDEEITKIFDNYRQDPRQWFSEMGIPLNNWTCKLAEDWINNQPDSTIKNQAHAVIKTTSNETYLQCIQNILNKEIPFNLIAGSRSAVNWDIPGWLKKSAAKYIEIKNANHMMMAEAPNEFAKAVISCCR